MLTQKQQTLPYIGIFKLNSGEEFIAKVVEETMMGFTIFKPLCMVPTDKGYQFAPLVMMGDLEAKVFLPKPVINTSPNPQLMEQYESTISPIIVPKKSGIVV